MKIINFKETGFTTSVFLILLAACFCAINAQGASGKSKEKTKSVKVESKDSNSFVTPDFAFPETVDVNAGKELDKALSAGDDVKALRAAMQTVIARNLISKENYKVGVELFDRLSKELKAPYSQLASLLKAQILVSIYQSEPWTFNNRTVPMNPVPENVMEWSRDIFANQIVAIVSELFANSDVAKETPISAISSIIENDKDAAKMGMSVYDFMTLKACDLLGNFDENSAEEIIPFGTGAKGNKKTEQSASELLNNILSDNIQWQESQNNQRLAAFMSYYKLDKMPWRQRNSYAEECVKKYIDTPYCGAFILALPDYPEEVMDTAEEELDKQNKALKKRYKQIEDYLARFPKCENEKALKNRLTVLNAEKISVSVSGRLYPGEPGKINVSASNVFDFNILVVKLPDSYINKNINLNAVAGVGKIAQVVPIHFTGERPINFEQKFDLAALQSGVYVLVPSKNNTFSGIITGTAPKLSMSTFTVSNLASMLVKGEKTDENRLYVVDGKNQNPVVGAKVTFTPQYNNGKQKQSVSRTTNKDGFVNIPVGSYNFKVSHNGNLLTGNVWNNSYGESKERKEILGKVLTDLSVYHPGDSVGFLGILYTRDGNELRQLPETKVKAELMDANWQSVDTAQFVSDKFGRIYGKFAIPESGLLGQYVVEISDDDNSEIAQGYFEVADYKSPTFYVVTEGTEGSYQIGDTIKIKGKASTYSGMPVSGGVVKYNIRYMPLRWLSANVNATYGGEATTEADGSFVISLPTEGLRNTRFAFGGYRLNVTVTNPAGETQEAPGVFFSLGEAYSINATIPEKICTDDGMQTFNVRVNDIVGKPVKKTVYYKIFKTGDKSSVIKEGKFESPRFEFDPSLLASGRYTIKFSLDKDFKAKNEGTAEANIIIYRKNDKRPPYETSLWIPEDNIVADKGAKSVKVKIGSAYNDSWILVQISDCNKVISREWLKVNDAITAIEVPAPADNDRVTVTVSGMHDFTQNIQFVTVIPYTQTEQVKIAAESFRDRITPGAREQWKFKFTMTDNALVGLPVSAVMSNKALNAIVPFAWNFNPMGSIYYNTVGNVQPMYFDNGGRWNLPLTKVMYGGMDRVTYPTWDLYGLALYAGSGRLSNLRIRGGGVKEELQEVMPTSLVVKKSAIRDEMKDEESETVVEDRVYMASAQVYTTGAVLNESAVVNSADNGTSTNGEGGLKKEEPLREIDMPLAFFMPQMITDADGDVMVDFTVPQFNGTWQFQIMGYTEDMRGAVSVMDAVASKPVMVQMNAPRFVRTGDKVSIAAMLYNNSVEPRAISGRIEIIDPVSCEAIASYSSAPISIEPAGSSKVSTDFNVPDNLNGLMIRVYALNDDFTDGEQTVIPVYPSSTPVLEAKTFYIAPGQDEFKMKIPSLGNNSKITLQYCDNPIWEVVTALPDISEPKSSNILSIVYSLYGNAIGAGLAKDYPEITEAIKIFANPENSKDSTLVSNLEKNQDLKNVLLNNTPWLRSAQSETLRMQSLTKYADAKRSEEIIASTLKEMAKLQNADGGWSWCAGMKSSDFITARVLLHLAMLKDMGYLPADALAMARKAVKFADESWVKSEKEYKGSTYPYVSMLNYLYVRSNFKDVQQSPAFAAMAKKGLTAVKNGWKKMDIYNKGVASILMNRSGYNMEARTILESLRQYASVSTERGMWFDNLSSAFGSWNKLITTAQVLEAYSEIQPESGNIDKLRQWLLMQKQAEDWGDDRDMAEVIYAILNSGTKWTVPSAPAEIMIDGKRLEIDRVARLTGNLTVNVTAKKNGQLEIRRSASGPAWGGLISQYVAPIRDVKKDGSAELSITKNLYTITDDASGSVATAGNLKVGDKVRVTLTLTTDRDLEYVAVMDARSACLEPSEQVSGYTASDGVWMYKEVRDNSTNLFIPFLSKGTHVISYDCYVDREGSYSLGIASAQSQYAPAIAAHSAGTLITVTN